MKTSDKTLCVVGASGLVGSNIVKAGLDRGYTVHGTMRDKDGPSKASFLNALAGASERLSLFSADMAIEKTFDEAMVGADCIFIACLIPTYAGPSGNLPGCVSEHGRFIPLTEITQSPLELAETEQN